MDPEATTLQVHSQVLARREEHCRFLITPTAGHSAGHKVSDEFVRFVAVTATPRAMMTSEIDKGSAEEEEFSELRHRIKTGTWRDEQLKQYISVASERCLTGKLILRGTRIVIPSKLRPRVLTLAHEGHPGIVSMK